MFTSYLHKCLTVTKCKAGVHPPELVKKCHRDICLMYKSAEVKTSKHFDSSLWLNADWTLSYQQICWERWSPLVVGDECLVLDVPSLAQPRESSNHTAPSTGWIYSKVQDNVTYTGEYLHKAILVLCLSLQICDLSAYGLRLTSRQKWKVN